MNEPMYCTQSSIDERAKNHEDRKGYSTTPAHDSCS